MLCQEKIHNILLFSLVTACHGAENNPLDNEKTSPQSTPTLQQQPIPTPKQETPVTIDAGGSNTCVILEGGTLKCWGFGAFGSLGQGSLKILGDETGEMANLKPIDLGKGRTAKAVSTESLFTCAILDDDTVKCWGFGLEGSLGQENQKMIGDDVGEVANLKPVNLGEGRTAKAISTGHWHTCALLDNNTVKCWGGNDRGQLGQGNKETLGDEPGEMANLEPINLGEGRTAKAISAGYLHTCALLDNNTVKCWGEGSFGKFGRYTGNLGDEPGEMASLEPINLGAGRTAKAISAGSLHTCAILDDDTVKCWGFGGYGELGQGKVMSIYYEMANLEPINLGEGRTAKAISAGDYYTCALLDNSAVKCWGKGENGRLGQGNTENVGDEPGEIAGLAPINLGRERAAKAISAGSSHACALLDNSAVKCWGKGENGQLGQGSTKNLGDEAHEMGDALPPIKL